jgi:CBS domain-containing protein
VVVDTVGRLTGVLSDRDLLRFMSRESHWDSATVASVMKPQPITARPETLLSTAAAEMLTRRINCLPIVDTEERVCGVLTSTDLMRVFHKVQEWIEQAATK